MKLRGYWLLGTMGWVSLYWISELRTDPWGCTECKDTFFDIVQKSHGHRPHNLVITRNCEGTWEEPRKELMELTGSLWEKLKKETVNFIGMNRGKNIE